MLVAPSRTRIKYFLLINEKIADFLKKKNQKIVIFFVQNWWKKKLLLLQLNNPSSRLSYCSVE